MISTLMDADTPETAGLRAQLAAIFRTSSQAYQSAAHLTLQQADLIQSGNSITAQDITSLSLQLPLIMPIVGLGVGSGATGTGEGGKKKGRKTKAEESSLSDLFRHHPSSAIPELNADGTKKRKRAPAKPRDPNAPKRPPSAYLLYQNELRKEIKEKNPELSYPEVLQEISKMWTALGETEKKPYLDATELAKKEYEKAKAEYDKTLPTGAVGAAPTDEASSVADADSPVPVVPAKGRPSAAAGKAPASKVAEKKKAGKTSLVPEPAVAESSESDDSDSSEEEGDEDEEDDEVEEPPKKKSKKDKTLPHPPSSSKKEKEKKRK